MRQALEFKPPCDPCRTFLGNGEPVKARRAAYSALSIGLIATVTTAVLTYACHTIGQVVVAHRLCHIVECLTMHAMVNVLCEQKTM